MRSALEAVEDLKNRYIDLPEYKRHYVSMKESTEKNLNLMMQSELNSSKSKEFMNDKFESLMVGTPSKYISCHNG